MTVKKPLPRAVQRDGDTRKPGVLDRDGSDPCRANLTIDPSHRFDST